MGILKKLESGIKSGKTFGSIGFSAVKEHFAQRKVKNKQFYESLGEKRLAQFKLTKVSFFCFSSLFGALLVLATIFVSPYRALGAIAFVTAATGLVSWTLPKTEKARFVLAGEIAAFFFILCVFFVFKATWKDNDKKANFTATAVEQESDMDFDDLEYERDGEDEFDIDDFQEE